VAILGWAQGSETGDELAKVIYSSKDRRESQTFNALDWLAQLVIHIPNKGEQMVRYYVIQRIYEVDPLLCPKCHGAMRIIAFIEEQPVILKILSYLGLWETRNHDPLKARGDPLPRIIL
jgi:hypothetical protein